MTVEELYTNFCDNFKGICTSTPDTDHEELCRNINHYFYDLGLKNDLAVYTKPHIVKQGKQGFLVDLCWASKKNSEDCYGLDLALESEWGSSRDQIMDDFYKLMVMKAFIKLMVIGRFQQEINSLLEAMCKTIQNSSVKYPEEEYLIIFFPDGYKPKSNIRKGQIFVGYKITFQGKLQPLKPHFLNNSNSRYF